MRLSKTYLPKQSEITHKYYLVDASDKVLGRLAAKVAAILRGKHKAIFTPHLDTGDNVIIINAAKIRVTGKKIQDKIYQRYTGYPSGLKVMRLEELMKKEPTKALRLAIHRMIPGNRLGNKIARRLRIYAGDKHPHQAQKPIALDI